MGGVSIGMSWLIVTRASVKCSNASITCGHEFERHRTLTLLPDAVTMVLTMMHFTKSTWFNQATYLSVSNISGSTNTLANYSGLDRR